MELSTIEHVLLARAALATGNPDALEALVHAALAPDAAMRERARSVLIAEANARGIEVPKADNAPDDAPVTLADYVHLKATGSTADPAGQPRWLAAAIRLATTRHEAADPATGGLARGRS
jgi:hypothetical protein